MGGTPLSEAKGVVVAIATSITLFWDVPPCELILKTGIQARSASECVKRHSKWLTHLRFVLVIMKLVDNRKSRLSWMMQAR